MGQLLAAAVRLKTGFSSLQGSPRDLVLVFVLKVLESYNYFSLSRILVLYLTEQFDVSDTVAGTLYGVWGTLLTLYGLFLGGAIDWLGVKVSLQLCFLLNVGSRLVMAWTSQRWLLLLMLLGPNTMAGSLGVPVMTICVKRYTTPANRGFAFSLFYTLMNLAALSQGVIMDFFRIKLAHGFNIAWLRDDHLLNNGSRLFLASGCCTSLLGLVMSFWLTEPGSYDGSAPSRAKYAACDTAEGSYEGSTHRASSPEVPLVDGSMHSSSGDAFRPLQQHTSLLIASRQAAASSVAAAWQHVAEIGAMPGFWKFMCMCLITVNLKGIFRHLDATLPKYMLRAYGPDSPIGLIYSINPAMIVLLVPLVGALTTALSHFDMIHYGAYLSAMSPLWMVLWEGQWATAAFVATLSLGEAVWSPRWYDYSMSVAPNGKEGVFTALTSAPLFVAMLPTGVLSGYLLQGYCPADGSDCDGRTLWGIVWAITMTSPLLITATARWVRPDLPVGAIDMQHLAAEPSYDVNEADPAAALEHIAQAHLETGGSPLYAAGGEALRLAAGSPHRA